MAFNSLVAMREQGLFLRKVARRAMNRDLNKGWNAWFDFLDSLEEDARQQRVMAAVVHRYLNKNVSAALNTWIGQLRELQRQRNLLRRAAHPCGPRERERDGHERPHGRRCLKTCWLIAPHMRLPGLFVGGGGKSVFSRYLRVIGRWRTLLGRLSTYFEPNPSPWGRAMSKKPF